MTSQTPDAVEQPANHSPLTLPLFGLGSGQLCTAPATPTPAADIVTALRSVELLHGLTDDEYLWLATHSSERVGPDQAIVFQEGQPAHHFSIILKGEICVYRKNAGLVTLSIGRTGQLTGKLPYSRMKTWGGGGSTSGPAWILDIHEALFPAMLLAIPSMSQRCVSILVDRTRDFTRAEQQAEKLDALGKLAANLSHELKNPASAAQRAALNLLSNIDRDEELCRLGRLFDSDEELTSYRQWACRAGIVIEKALAKAEAGSVLSVNDREDALLNWLEARRVPEAWSLAPVFAAARLPISSIEELESLVNKKVFPAALASFSTSLNARLTVKTIADSSSRIFSIIKAIQDYSYMDQAPVQDVDLVQSVESALTLLHSQSTGITIIRDYNPSMPKITGYGGELSQVWTALIENAFAAMNGRGVLKVTVTLNGVMAFIEFWDDGPGIDPAISSRIFEPFFTTKPIGQALGLGLDTVRRIVHKHLGSVTVQSIPFSTCFQVRLPMNRPQVY
jgi:signal transduction histidine kinase